MRRALAFLTSVGGAAVPDAGTLTWFPLAGVVIGATVGAAWWGADRLWPPFVAAAVVVALDVAITGMLHVDGLVDAADGLLSHLPPERRMEVMADPSVGAFGVGAAVTVLLLRWTSLAAIPPDVALLAAIWCGSRTLMAVAARALPYAREAGLASAMLGGAWLPVALLGAALALGLGVLAEGGVGAAAVAAGFIAGAAVVMVGRRRLGGFTGDVLGAAGMVGETAALLVAAARW